MNLGPDTTVVSGTTLTLTVGVNGGVEPYRYLWSTLDTLKSITVTVTQPTTFIVFVFDAQQNYGIAQQKVNVYPVGDKELSNTSFAIFPNPSDGHVTISYPDIKEPVSLEVINSMGQIVEKQIIKRLVNQYLMDFSDLPKGIYLLRISTQEKIYTGKIVLRK